MLDPKRTSSRTAALQRVEDYFQEGKFVHDLSRLVAMPTESQRPEQRQILYAYLERLARSEFRALGFRSKIFDNPEPAAGPFLISERIEDANLPTVVLYGHGDVVSGNEEAWSGDLSPWEVVSRDGRIYGRGTADNKGQHWIVMSALATVLAERGELGFNCKFLMETGEEMGSPGLQEFCRAQRDKLSGELMIASDGPRQTGSRPALVFGSRGSIRFNLRVDLRDAARHSGNWGGILKDPGQILVQALATISDERGRIQIPEWRPKEVSNAMRVLINGCTGPDVLPRELVDDGWGETDLTAGERLLAWSSFAIIALELGDPARPMNAIQPSARACCQLRFVKGVDPEDILPALRRHLDAHGFGAVEVSLDRKTYMNATRLEPGSRWAGWAIDSVEKTMGEKPHVVPNIGGTLPNHIFVDDLDLETIWVPHSYPGCSQHAADEHLLESVALEGLKIMTGLFWDLGEMDGPLQ